MYGQFTLNITKLNAAYKRKHRPKLYHIAESDFATTSFLFGFYLGRGGGWVHGFKLFMVKSTGRSIDCVMTDWSTD